MGLWFVMVLMTAAAVFAVLWPLARGATRSHGGGSDVAVYRDQLGEIERDRAGGLIAPADAEAARVEVSRRLLAAADHDAASPALPSLWRRRAVAILALVLLPVGASGLYLALGSPTLPGQPLASRMNAPANQRSIADLVAQVEAHVERNPDDGRGWEVLAPVYLRTGRFDEAVKARSNALRLLGATPEREADLGEALTSAANGIVTADAKAAFDRAVAADPRSIKARFFLGLAAEQDGRKDDAARIWRELLAGAPPDAPWTAYVKQSLAQLTGKPVPEPAPPTASAPGPDAGQVAAAQAMTSDQRAAMIQGMVAGLAEKLKHDGSDIDGWSRLMRAYMVLGERDKARAAAADARQALRGDPDKLRRLDDVVKGLGVEG